MVVCGIAGLLDAGGGVADLEGLARAMSDAIAHRGPDDSGIWIDGVAGIAFGHRRLAVIDLSPAGHQPMVSASGRTVLVFNGELYNHHEIRRELEQAGHRFRGRSDTEVLVEAIERWGVRRALERSNAMLAIAVWDRDRRVLTLARDRLGEKPLYFGRIDNGRGLGFASELKALRVLPGFDTSIDERAVASLMRWSFVPHPLTICRGAAQLAPGTILEVRAVNGAIVTDEVRWWSIGDVAARGQTSRRQAEPADATEHAVELLRDSVRLRLESDVPMGAFLSGGVDSSMVAALAQESMSGAPLRTFTVRMPEVGFDESEPAAEVARHLGTDHTTIDLSERDALEAIPSLPRIYDEPFADPSMLPTALLCSVTRQHLTVSLAGDGGDEVFGGYNRHALGHALWRRAGRVPRPLRRLAARSLLIPSPSLVDATATRLRRVLPDRLDLRNPGDKVQKMAAMLGTSGTDLWATLAATWPNPEALMVRDVPKEDLAAFAIVLEDPVEEMLLLDTELVLPDEMLVKVDRASMASALEVRLPFLDHRVVEWAWTLPMSAKVSGGQGKRIVRRALRNYLPDAIVDRPKMGFDPPLAAWLRGPLRPWAEELLSEQRLRADGWFQPAPIRKAWAEHLSGSRNWDYRLWAVLMFNAWLTEYA